MDDPEPHTVGEPDPIIWATTLEKLDALMRTEPTMWRYL